MRLDKLLVEASVGTRKIVRRLVYEGKVTVNDHVCLNPAEDINEDRDMIRYLGEIVVRKGKCYYMFHKPAGCITARKDISSKTVLDYFNVDNRNGLFPVGRLDKDTEGLILVTNDGEFNHNLMYPDKHVEKTYYFWAFGSLDTEKKERLKTGISIGDEGALAKAIHVEVLDEGLYSELKDKMDIVNRKEIRMNSSQQTIVSGNITITEGRKHQVKRMLKAVGCYVVYLKRVSIGGLSLDETLEKGQYRELTDHELNQIFM